MAITLKRQLNDEEKNIILKRHGRVCFATGHTIPDSDSLHFDHIRAYIKGGESELDNIAPMCEYHNKAKGTLPLEDFRIKLRLEDFFNLGSRLTLRDILKYLKSKGDVKSFGESITFKIENHSVNISNHSFNQTFQIQICPLTGWNYFYATLPVSILNSDDDDVDKTGLQPRYLIFDKVFQMFRHFQIYPVLQPSLGRVANDKILLYDGQHKAASLLWNGRTDFECKIYIDPDVRLLNQANIAAHDQFAQTRFFSSIMILKLGMQFGKDFEEYKSRSDILVKTEVNLLEFLEQKDPTLKRAERNKRFRSYLFNSVLENEDNKLKGLISTSNRSSNEQPLTIDMLQKSIFANFMYTAPMNDNLLSDKYQRDSECVNVLKLMNLLYDMSLNAWNPKASVNDQAHIKLRRIYSSKSIFAWFEIFRDAVCAKLEIHDSDEKLKPFYRELTDDDFNKIKAILMRLFNWQVWSSPSGSEIDTVISTSKSYLKDWFREKGLTAGFLLGAPI